MKKTLLLALLGLCLVVQVSAQIPLPEDFTTTRGLMEICKTTDVPVSVAYCAGYLVAAAEALGWQRYADAARGLGSFSSCPAIGRKTTEQLTAVFLMWAESHPNRWHDQRAVGVRQAFTETWPCKDTIERDDKP